MSSVTDPFIVIEGGLVANDPELPVYNLDVLDTDFVDQETFCDVSVMRDRASAHASRLSQDLKHGYYAAQIAALTQIVERCEKWMQGNVAYDPDR